MSSVGILRGKLECWKRRHPDHSDTADRRQGVRARRPYDKQGKGRGPLCIDSLSAMVILGVLRPPSGRMVLAGREASGFRVSPRRARLPRRLLCARRRPDVGPDGRGLAGAPRSGSGPVIPGLLVFAYLGVVLYIGDLRVPADRGARAAPRTTSWPAGRSARWCSCCRSSAPT